MVKKSGSMKTRRMIADTATHIFLTIMCLLWLVPFVWLIAQSFREGKLCKAVYRQDGDRFPQNLYEHAVHCNLYLYHQYLFRAGRFLLYQPFEMENAQTLHEPGYDHQPVPGIYVHGCCVFPSEGTGYDGR